MPPLLSGRDAVVAAETGSGKTLAYLAPIVSQMLAGRRQGGDASAAPSNEQRGGCARGLPTPFVAESSVSDTSGARLPHMRSNWHASGHVAKANGHCCSRQGTVLAFA